MNLEVYCLGVLILSYVIILTYHRTASLASLSLVVSGILLSLSRFCRLGLYLSLGPYIYSCFQHWNMSI